MWFWFFVISASVNIFLLLYVRWLLAGLKSLNYTMESTSDMIRDFSEHLSSIYELEMFYGDQTLQNLLTHSRELKKTLEEIDFLLNDEEKEDSDFEETPPQRN